ncbi:Bdr family repetitive protein [Borrelia hermsii]|nr:Bdr family repetitive protein [Borrelia hermsii]
MNNLAYKTYRTEDLRMEFLNKGFTEEAVDFILLHNDNSNFEVLREKMNSLEQQMINVEQNLKKDIEFIRMEFGNKLENLDTKIDNVEKNLQKDISNLERSLLKEIESNNAVLREELKRNNAILLEKLKIGNRMLNLISLIGMPIITSILVYIITNYFGRG